jgi:tellurite resistance-related uncharacterized protein
MAEPVRISYKPPGPVGRDFMKDLSFVRGIRGPIGSGKSVTCCIEIMRLALAMPRSGRSKKRQSRWCVIRNTQGELRTTTIKTWLDWFPEHEFGKFNWSPPFTHKIRKGDVEMEVIFLALDREDDVKKLLSLELTGAWINEAREIPKAILDMLTGRVGRFPKLADLDGQDYRACIFMDTNAMEPDHWWPILAGEAPIPEDMDPVDALTLQRPENWRFFVQPEAVVEKMDGDAIVGYEINPAAENLPNLRPDYYSNQIAGKTRSWIRVYLQNRLGYTLDGALVYPTFSDERHMARSKLVPQENHVVGVGIDFGLTPAAIIGQNVMGRFRIMREIVATSMGAERFADQLLAVLSQPPFAGMQLAFWGDPAGDSRAQTDERTPFDILRAKGINAQPAPTNDFVERQQAVEHLLNQRIGDLEVFLLDPSCTILRAGFARGYHYPMVQGVGGKRPADRPMKNRYSHPHDALQYLVLGLGGGRMLLNRTPVAKPSVAVVNTRTHGTVMDRLTRRLRGRGG